TMRDTLVRLGVPSSRVIVKSESVDTHDEAQQVARLLPTLNVDRVILVTSSIHMRRAVATFRAAGVTVIASPAREQKPGSLRWQLTYLPSERGLYEASLVAHELLGMVYYKISGWI